MDDSERAARRESAACCDVPLDPLLRKLEPVLGVLCMRVITSFQSILGLVLLDVVVEGTAGVGHEHVFEGRLRDPA